LDFGKGEGFFRVCRFADELIVWLVAPVAIGFDGGVVVAQFISVSLVLSRCCCEQRNANAAGGVGERWLG
jgi:hypothetical protein